ncbi:GNAT family N-acetyltransferase [Nonomuraea sp. NPDC049309]|uniref:GNAT family N-acetyltransferase n=1 Tax=Nonomuraea sp. NPDC049309 TaxID=3364350 RepID=UPI003713B807
MTTLAEVLRDAQEGRFPPPDGGVTLVPQPSPRDLGVLSFTAHAVVFADVDPAWIRKRLPPGDLDAPLGPSFLLELAALTGRAVGNLDLLAVARPLPGPAPLALEELRDSAHPRVARARRYRDDVRVWVAPAQGVSECGAPAQGVFEWGAPAQGLSEWGAPGQDVLVRGTPALDGGRELRASRPSSREESPAASARDGGRGSGRDGAGDGGRGSGRDGAWDGGRERGGDSAQDGGRDGAGDSARDGAQDGGRDGAGDSGCDGGRGSGGDGGVAGLLAVGRGVGGRWEVAIEVEPDHRGRGLGRLLATAARHLAPGPLWAQVAPGNAASVRAFIAAGYAPVGAEVLLSPEP